MVNREPIIAAVARHGVPAVYPLRPFAASGGLMSYGVDQTDNYRGAASYVDRIFKGEKPSNFAGAATDKGRACDQFENREGAWH
jgi:putative tryptophan/tyrosine transport system substrate-binding protein